MLIKAVKKEIIKIEKNPNTKYCSPEEIIWNKLKKLEIEITGIPINRENSADFTLFNPPILKAVIEAPDLLIPGIMARHWIIPAKNEVLYDKDVFCLFFPNRSDSSKIIPPRIDTKPIVSKLKIKLLKNIVMIAPIKIIGIDAIIKQIKSFWSEEEYLGSFLINNVRLFIKLNNINLLLIITASNVPKWAAIAKYKPMTGQSKILSKYIRWAELDMGKNSVVPWTMEYIKISK